LSVSFRGCVLEPSVRPSEITWLFCPVCPVCVDVDVNGCYAYIRFARFVAVIAYWHVLLLPEDGGSPMVVGSLVADHPVEAE